jgi:hypothetical protein
MLANFKYEKNAGITLQFICLVISNMDKISLKVRHVSHVKVSKNDVGNGRIKNTHSYQLI